MSEMRVSTAEREEYLSALADSHADGRLDDAGAGVGACRLGP